VGKKCGALDAGEWLDPVSDAESASPVRRFRFRSRFLFASFRATTEQTAQELGESGDVDRLAVRPYTVKAGSCQEKVVAERAVIGLIPSD
jgi:hypothetical protein